MQPVSAENRPSSRLNAMNDQRSSVDTCSFEILKSPNDFSSVALHAMEVVDELKKQVAAGEHLRQTLEVKILERNKFYKNVSSKIDMLVKQKDAAMTNASSCQAEAIKLKHDICDMSESTTRHLEENKKLTSDAGSLQKRLQSTESELNSKWEETKSNQRQIRTLEVDCVSKQCEIISLQAKCEGLVRAKAVLEQKQVEAEARLEHNFDETNSLRQQLDMLSARLSAFGTVNEMTMSSMDKLLSELSKVTKLLDEERVAKGQLVIELKLVQARKEALMEEARTLGQELEKCKVQNDCLQLQNLAQIKDFADGEKSASARYAELQALSDSVTKDKTELEVKLASSIEAVGELQTSKASVERAFTCAEEDHKMSTLAVEKQLEDSRSALADLQALLQGECAKYAVAMENMEELRRDCKMQAEKIVDLEEQRTFLKSELKEAQRSAQEVEQTCRLVKEESEKQLQAKEAGLQQHLQEISQQNNQAIAEMRNQYQQEASRDIQATKLQAEKSLTKAEEKARAMEQECEKLAHILKDALDESAATKLKQDESVKGLIVEIAVLKAAQAEIHKKRLEENEEVAKALVAQSQNLERLQDEKEKLKNAKNESDKESSEIRKEIAKLQANQIQIEVDLGEERKVNNELNAVHAEKLKEIQIEKDIIAKESAVQRQCVINLEEENTNLKAALGSLCQVKNAHPPQPLTASKAKSAKIASAEKSLQAAQSVAQKKGLSRKKKVRAVPDVENDEILNAVPQVVQQQVEKEEVVQVTSPGSGRRTTPRKRARAETVLVHNVKKGPKTQSVGFGELCHSGSLNPYHDDPYAFA